MDTSNSALRDRARQLMVSLRERAEQIRRDGPPAAAGVLHVGRDELRRQSVSLVAGVLGSLAAILVMVGLRLAWGTPTLPELLGERILPLLPAHRFTALVGQFEPHPKTAPLALELIGQFALGVLLGPALHLAARAPTRTTTRWPSRRAALTAAAFALAMEAVALLIFWPVLAAGLFGDPLGRARLLTAIGALLTFVTFAGVMLLADHWLRRVWGAWATAPGEAHLASPASPAPAPLETSAIGRRDALKAAGAVVLAVAVGGVVLDRLLDGYLARSNLGYEGIPTPADATSYITPPADFYVVSKNVLDPTVAVGQWQLEVEGLVGHTRAWSFEQLRMLPGETRVVTFECIANPVGGHLLSTAEWHGVALQTVLDRAGGATRGAKDVVFQSVDGYATSLPLADLLAARTLLAWQMNGAPLPQRHGFPLRAVVPGRYGEQSPKWLTRISLADRPFKGLYQSQGWSTGPLSTMSRIDSPRGQAGAGAVTVAGVAFAGTRGVSRVEVSADNGATWQEAALTPPRSDQSWVLWSWQWLPPAPGTYTLVVRATDGTGAVQTASERGIVPDGATGLHHVRVRVI